MTPSSHTPEDRFLDALDDHLPKSLQGAKVRTKHTWNLHRLFVSCHWYSPEGEEPQTVAKLRLQVIPEEQSLWLGDIEVTETIRHQGIGRTIVVAVERAATDASLKRIRLYSRLSACTFWKHLGYRSYAQTQYLEKILI